MSYKDIIISFDKKEDMCEKKDEIPLNYSNIYSNYEYYTEINSNVDYTFNNVILDPNLMYKKMESLSFKEQYNNLLKRDENLKEYILKLRANIDNTLYSNIPILGNKNEKTDKIRRDLDNIFGNILFYDNKYTIAEKYYINLKSNKYYVHLYDFYLKYGSRYYRNTHNEQITWQIGDHTVRIEPLATHDNGKDNYIELYINQERYRISNAEDFSIVIDVNIEYAEYLIYPIVQIFHNIELLKGNDNERPKWYIILHKLLKLYTKFIKKI